MLLHSQCIEIKSKMLEKWYRTYHSVMSMPALKSHLYMSSLSENEEAKFNVMHTTFALMHTYHQLDKDALDKGSSLFTILLDKYFNDTTLQVFYIVVLRHSPTISYTISYSHLAEEQRSCSFTS